MTCSMSARPTLDKVRNPWRNADKWTQEDFIRVMEYLGFKHKDFTGDGEGTKYKSWYYRTRREVEVSQIWWGGNGQLIFYKERENPIPEHPRKGKGKFKAIYLHAPYGICDVTLVEAEIANVQARITYLDGDELRVSRTSTTRLIPFHPAVFDTLRGLHKQYSSMYAAFAHMTFDTLYREHQESIKSDIKRTSE